MNVITRRIAAGFALAAAPALIAVGAAATSSAATTTGATNHGSSVSHPAFPHQGNTPQPGTSVHHHHQNRR
jgi:hypothetical protein